MIYVINNYDNQFGVGITSLGLNLAQLDDLPSSREIHAMSVDQFEKVQEKLRSQRITMSAPRNRIDWQGLSSLRKKYDSIADMIRWLSDCLSRGQPEWK